MYLLPELSETGKKITTQILPPPGTEFQEILRTCGQCTGCRVKRRMDLATRLTHEAEFHEHSWFVTTTYADEHLPYGGSLYHNHISEFIRALRDKLRPQKIRFFGVGEYGGKMNRPHYHFIIFGPDFPDKKVSYTAPSTFKHSDQFVRMFGPSGAKYYESEFLSNVWKKGLVQLTSTSSATMEYVAKFHIDKVTGDRAESYYSKTVEETGEIISLESEQARMSRRPGLGHAWIEKYWTDVYPHGYMIAKNGSLFAPPAYYDKWLEKHHPELYEQLKIERANAVSIETFLYQKREAINATRNSQISTPAHLPIKGRF